MTCDKISENLKDCNCTYEPCVRKGKCCECIRYHQPNELPACFFNSKFEKTYNRSYDNFMKQMQEK